jgi:acyl-CoA thioesterase
MSSIADEVDGMRLYARDKATQALGLGHGICHGGVIFSLADTAFAYACDTRGTALGVHCTISFLAPARLGEILLPHAFESALKGRSGIYDVTVKNKAGENIALFRGVSQRLKETAHGSRHTASDPP